MMDENGPFVASVGKNIPTPLRIYPVVSRNAQPRRLYISNITGRHCVTLSVIIPPPTSFFLTPRSETKDTRKEKKPVTRVGLSCRIVICAVHKREWMEWCGGGLTLSWSFDCPYTSNLQRESLSHGYKNRLWHNRKCVMSSRLLLSQNSVRFCTRTCETGKNVFIFFLLLPGIY